MEIHRNRKQKGKTMWENQENNENPAEAEVIKPTYEQLEEGYKTLELQAKMLTEGRDGWRNRYTEALGRVEELNTYLTDNWEELGDHAEAIADIFGLETTITKTVKWSVEIEMQITASRNFDFDSLDEGDFYIDVSNRGGNDIEIEDVDWSGTDIEVD